MSKLIVRFKDTAPLSKSSRLMRTLCSLVVLSSFSQFTPADIFTEEVLIAHGFVAGIRQLKFDNVLDEKVTLPIARYSISGLYKRVLFSVDYEWTLEEDDSFINFFRASEGGTPDQPVGGVASRREYRLAIDYCLKKRNGVNQCLYSLSAGYIDALTDVEFTRRFSDDCSDDVFSEEYAEKGLYLGSTLAQKISDGRYGELLYKISYSWLKGSVYDTKLLGGRDCKNSELSRFTLKGDTNGLSYGIVWNKEWWSSYQDLSALNFSFGIKQNNYVFMPKRLVSFEGNLDLSNELFNREQNFTLIFAGFFWVM